MSDSGVYLTNYDLLEASKKYNIPLRAVFSKDQIANPLPDGGYIINLQNRTNDEGSLNPGTHWTCFYKVKNKAVYFDSFGAPPPLEVQKALVRQMPIKYNDSQIQSINSGVCGYYCLYMIWALKHTKPSNLERTFNATLRKFSKNPEKNREILQHLLRFVK